MSIFNKRIFISYSHDSPDHEARVRQLADSLRKYGLDCRLDQYESDEPPEGWPLWMEDQIEFANAVLMICTETYLRRVRKQETPGVGRGVCWEANLIYAELYESQTRNTRFYPVIFCAEDRQFVPRPLGTTSLFCVSDNISFQELYVFLTGQQPHAPSIGVVHQVDFPAPRPTFELPGQLVDKVMAEWSHLSSDSDGSSHEKLLSQHKMRANEIPEPRLELRALDWYDEADAAFFRGRDSDVQRLRRLLLDSPIVRLFGPSGVGKSSLLRAGLVPELKSRGWRAVVVRPWDNPELHIPRLICEQLFENAAPSSLNHLDLETLQRELTPFLAAEFCPFLFLLVDQVEDIVSPFAPPESREVFVRFLRQVWESPKSFIKVALAYRTDSESRLGPLWQEISGQTTGLPYHTIQGVSTDAACDVIREAAEHYDWRLAVTIDELVTQLVLESRHLEASGEVFPPYLQILLAQATDVTTLDRQFLESLGGMSGLIGNYMSDVLAKLEEHGGDYLKCREVLIALSRSSGQKVSLTQGEIASEVGLMPESVAVLMQTLIEKRLVRPIGAEVYEIQHDRLADVVLASMADPDREAKQAQELLAIKRVNFEKTHEWLSQAEQHFLYMHRKHLRLRPEEQFLILGSILADNGIGWWFFQDVAEERVVDLLTQLVYRGKSSVRQAALIALAQWSRPRDIPVFSDLVRTDPDETVRQAALTALAQWPHSEDAALFADLAQTNLHWQVRCAALTALAQWPCLEDATLFVCLAQTDPDEDVRQAAFTTLAQWPHSEDAALFANLAQSDPDWQIRRATLVALAQWPRPEDAALFADLVQSDPEIDVRLAALTALAEQPRSEDISLFADLVRTNLHWQVRQVALTVLSQWPHSEDATLFVRLARNDPVEDIRQVALTALVQWSRSEDILLYAHLAQTDADKDVRQVALTALVQWSRSEDAALFVHLAKTNPHWQVRQAALTALAQWPRPEHLPLFADLAQTDPDEDVRQAALIALGQRPRPEDIPLFADLAQTDPHWQVRQAALTALAQWPRPEHLPLFADLAQTDPDEDVRQVALAALAKRPCPEHIRILADLAQTDSAEDIRQAALTALAQWPRPEDIPLFADLARTDPHWQVRQAALTALAQWPRSEDDIFMFVDLARTDPDRDIRQAALAVLAQRPRPEEDAALFVHLAQTYPRWQVRQAVLTALAQWPRPDDAALFANLAQNDSSEDIRQAALTALAQWPRPEDISLFADLAQNDSSEDIRQAALTALAQWPRPENAALFADLVRTNSRWQIRQAALTTLAQWPRPENAALFADLVRTEPDEDVCDAALGALLQTGVSDFLKDWLEEYASELSVDILQRLDQYLYGPDWFKTTSRESL